MLTGTNDLVEITQRRLIQISDEDAARVDDSIGARLPDGAFGGQRIE